MSHTTKINNTSFIHDGELNGEIQISSNGGSIRLPFEDLYEFVGTAIKNRKIMELENMSGKEYLKKIYPKN